MNLVMIKNIFSPMEKILLGFIKYKMISAF